MNTMVLVLCEGNVVATEQEIFDQVIALDGVLEHTWPIPYTIW